ncbi:SusC/RagA family TonB-linked outer membrane protein [Epilithonimonas sp. JDS]|uniref:SusC/RagA family TonB-linked outer membrane protein n=1 Tax=Epilithonimonas sp. JDS TaxID=2902797 RepID=UPI001E3EECE1|nr:SusC/RagA family TonB-linked outer membrane protein [Epilithonimonas sp. JDS]MCD9854150.1 SusC/RagA family TonB-linked outer membrane protein [Epilithonimonas sp. JDS]
MNVKLRLLSVGVLFFTGQALMAQKAKKDTASTRDIEEVVVIGNIKLDPAQKVGSYSTVSKANFESTPFSSIDEVLNGRVAGLNFSSASGDPGSSNMVIIRGVSSLIGTPNPLYIIDGVVVGKGADNAQMMESWNPLAAIDPNAIESVQVLKDASATALYGSRGANGVIIVKTKKGKYNQKTKFEFSTETGLQDRAFDKLDLMSGDEYIKYGSMLIWNSRGQGVSADAVPDMAAARKYFLENYENTYYNNGDLTGTNTDWVKAVTRGTSMVNTYNFGASGGGENTSFRIGGSYYQNKPLVLTSAFDRISINAAIDHKASDKLKFGLNVNYSNVKRNTYYGGRASANPVTSSIMISPLRPIYLADGSYNQEDLGEGSPTPGFNPVSILNEARQISAINTFIASANMDYSFAKNLSFNSLFGAQAVFQRERQIIQAGHPVFTIMTQDQGALGDFRTNTLDWNWSNTVNYHNVFGDRHSVDASGGMEYQDHTYNLLRVETYSTNSSDPYFQFSDVQFASGEDLAWRQISYFGRLNYSFDKKYSVSGQIRRDGNSTLGTEKFGTFWSIGGSWNVAQESFAPEKFSTFNLRASYGVLGNIPYADQWGSQYNSETLLGYNWTYNWGNGNGFGSIINAGNPLLTWEESKHLDIGADLGLFNDRLKFTLDYYRKITSSAIFDRNLSSESGGPSSFLDNLGTINNTGFELVIEATPVRTSDFQWYINANGAYSKTMLDKLNQDLVTFEGDDAGDATNALVALAPGHQLGEYYTWIWAGVATADDTTKGIKAGDALWYTNGDKTDVTNDKTKAERAWLGKSAFPLYNVGITNEFKYKNLTLSFLLSGQFDFYVQNGVHSYTLHDGRFPTRNQVTDALYDSWTDAPGMENFDANNPKAIIGNPSNSRLESTRFISKGDHIRLKEMKISYSLGDVFKKSVGLNNCTIYLRGTNLLTWAFDKGLNYDPESNSNSWSWLGKGRYWYASPVLRTVSMGIQLGF